MINNHVYREGDPPTHVYIILEGSIKIGESDRLLDQGIKKKGVRIINAEAVIGDQDLGE